MKRRILPMFMAVMMILSIIQVPAWAADGDNPTGTDESIELTDAGGDDSNEGEPETQDGDDVAQIGDTGYPTLQAAITEATDGQTVKLLTTVTESVTVEAGKNITLDLNGQTLQDSAEARDSNASGRQHTIINKGTLTIMGSGTVDNKSHACAALFNDAGANVTITGGAYTRSEESGSSSAENGGNSYYTLENYGTMTIGSQSADNDIKVTANGHYSSLVHNGWKNSGDVGNRTATMTIYGGRFTGGINTIKNDEGGNLTIYDGSFVNTTQYALQNWNIAVVEGGSFQSNTMAAVFNGYSEETSVGQLTIEGGEFISPANTSVLAVHNAATTSISGGTFSSDVSEYLADTVKGTSEGGNFIVKPLEEDDQETVAEVGGEYYKSLSAAIAAAKDSDTVTLLKSVEVASRIEITDDITLDLDGETLTSTADIGILVASNTSFELTGGTLDHKPASGNPMSGIFVLTGATFTLASDATIESTSAGVTGTNNTANEGNATFNIYGTIDCDDIGIWGRGPNNTYNIIGATIDSNYFGVYQNGSYGGCSVTIQDSTITDGLTNGCGVYISNSKGNAQNQAQGMQTLVIENSSITGATAVEVKYTDVTIAGENTVLTATGTPADDQLNNNGTVTTGYALAITHNGTTTSADSADGNVVVTGGIFNGEVGVQSPTQSAQTAAEVAISGGTFSSEVEDEYCAPGFEPTTIDGKYTVQLKEENFSAQIQNENGQIVAAYENLSGAVNAVKSGQTIVLLADVTDALPVPNVADVTYTAAEGVTVSGGMNGTVVGNLTLDGITFTEKDVYLNGKEDATVTVKDCTFSNVTAHGNKLGAFNMVTAGNLVFTGNTITGTKNATDSTEAVGIYTQNLTDVTISDNTIGAVSGTSINVNANKGTTTIKGNELTDWASAGGNTPGRAIRLSDSGDGKVTITGNKLVNSKETMESYIKISGVEGNTVDATKNYWNGKSPDAKAGDGKTLFEVADTTVDEGKITSEPYFEAATMRDPEDLSNYVPPVTPDDDDDSSSSSSSSSVRRYNIEADAGRGGDISPDGRVRVRRGENQTFRITADDGWEIADVEVDGESVGAVERYTFENVRTDHTISATFRQIVTEPEEPETPALPFTDVAEGDWYHDAVAYCWENGIMDGTSGTTFAPNLLLNRAMMAQVLYNLAGGTASTVAGFPDVAASAWYADAVNWAAANGYVTGYDNGSYGPEDSLTREQLAVILYRYAGSPAPAGSLDGFADAASASAYAVDALRWAVGEGLLTGKDGGRLDPTGTASRAELAQILARFAQM